MRSIALNRILLTAVLMLAAACSQAAPTTWYVDTGGSDGNGGTSSAPFKTIQKAVNTAAAGDTIQVAAGTYGESIIWQAKDLTILGAGAATCIIDPTAGGITNLRCLFAANGLTVASRIEGFTFQHGHAGPTKGGGMFAHGDLTIANCVFKNNDSDLGGGMFTSTYSPTITDCTFTGNKSPYGGGICNSFSTPKIIRCTFTGNSGNSGGGVYNDHSSPQVTDCTFTGNSVVSPSNVQQSGMGGGIDSWSSTPKISGCTFTGNTSSGANNVAGVGGAINLGGTSISGSSATITNCIINGSTADWGAGIYIWYGSSATVAGCSFVGNSTGGYGGAIYVNSNSATTVTNCTFVANYASWDGSAIANGNTPGVVTNCVVWGNTIRNSYANGPIYGASVSYTNLQGLSGTPDANHNFGADPLFVRNPNIGAGDYGNLQLRLSSLCIDSGNDAAVSSPPFRKDPTDTFIVDLAGNARTYGGHVDLGALERQANNSPSAADDSYTLNEDATLNSSAPGLLANDSDPNGDTMSSVLVSGPAHGSLTLNVNGSFTYVPDANYNGFDSFTYKATDGQAESGVVTVSLTINAVNDPPTVVNDSVSTDEDSPCTVAVLDNDSDVEGNTLSVISVSQVAHGSVVINADGSVTYTPAPNYNGADSFIYTVSDGNGGTSTGTVNVNVSPANDPPSLTVPASVGGTVGASLTYQATATDPDGDALTYSLVNPPAGAAIDPNTGVVTWTPAASGLYQLMVRVTDPSGASDTKTTDVVVRGIVIEGVTLTRDLQGTISVKLLLHNVSPLLASNVTVTAATLGGVKSNTPLPQYYFNIKAGASKQGTLKFKKVPAGGALLIIQGSSSLGSFSFGQNVSVP